MNTSLKDLKIGVIGLGYVGLPLAVEFGKKYQTLGFVINQLRVSELLAGHDATLEVSDEELENIASLSLGLLIESALILGKGNLDKKGKAVLERNVELMLLGVLTS